MTTVKEFKDLGVKFIKCDQYSHSNCSVVMFADEITLEWISRGSKESQSAKIHNFAWRQLNTLPDNPKFDYEVDTNKHEWRPLLDQSQTETPEETEAFNRMKPYEFNEHVSCERIGVMSNGDEVELVAANDNKPAFTQAMADAGELPEVGSELEMFKHSLGGNRWVQCYAVGYTKDLNHLVIHDDDEDLHFAGNELCHIKFRALDNRTPKQKAVDKMFEDAEVQGSKGAFERLYDKGYRKW